MIMQNDPFLTFNMAFNEIKLKLTERKKGGREGAHLVDNPV